MNDENILVNDSNVLIANTPLTYNNKAIFIGAEQVEIGKYNKVEIEYLKGE